MRSLGLSIVLFAASLVWGCGGDDEEEELPEVDCDGGVPTYAEVDAFEKCTVCHSSEKMGAERQDANEEFNFDTYAAAKHEPEEVAHEVFEGAMPPPESMITLTDEEKEGLYLWTLCGTPE